MIDYAGARFFKCDLQMQTPADAKHWMGEKYDMSVDAPKAAAEYISRCLAESLEVIAITDHNFASKDFIPLFRREASSQAKGAPITIFPGFEFTANVGKGVHVLALFDPDKDLNEIDHILTECGVPNPRQSSSGDHLPSSKPLSEILDIVQGKHKGIVILPHVQSNDGIFDNNKIAEWLQADEFRREQLLAVEIPKSVSKMSQGFQNLLSNGPLCDPAWKRVRPIAKLMSSDCKSINPSDKTPNHIGHRFSWIRMSKPSIESLRQAFLDESSRIRISDDHDSCPDKSIGHPHISSISVKGAQFLSDTAIKFSPHLNAFIGGRGTGKSTLLEYLRIALGRTSEVPEALRADFESLQSTLQNGGSVSITYWTGSDYEQDEWQLDCFNGREPTVNGDAEVGRLDSFFPARVYSRSQIEEIANDPKRQRDILDDLNGAELQKLEGIERELVSTLQSKNSALSQYSDLQREQAELRSQILTLQARIKKVQDKSAALDGWQNWEREKRLISRFEALLEERLAQLSSVAAQLPLQLLITDLESPQKDIVARVQAQIQKISAELKINVAQAIDSARTKAAAAKDDTERQKWEDGLKKAEEQYETALASLEADGVDPNDHKRNVELLDSLQQRLAAVSKKLEGIDKLRTEIRELVTSELAQVWRAQFEVRVSAAKQLNEAVPRTNSGAPTVKCEVLKHGDLGSFLNQMKHIPQDNRRVSKEDWRLVLEAAFSKGLTDDLPPVLILEEWINQYSKGQSNIPGFPSDVSRKKLETIADWMPEEVINTCLFTRIPDAVTVALHRREDGKKVGELRGRNLSAGQKSTTVLSMILAAGSEPVLIDQPEDDLDNEFVYEQLVPLLRERKEERQIIVVSHNANIPVNGDAELIIPLEVANSRGAIKTLKGIPCIGALDRSETRDSVELILEGSADAFRRRREKYGF